MPNDNNSSKQYAKTLFDARQEFIVLGLCGKTGSGVSTVARILENDFSSLNLPVPCEECNARIDKTEYLIAYKFAKENWKPFYKIKTSALITLTAFNKGTDMFTDFLKKLIISEQNSDDNDKVDQQIKNANETLENEIENVVNNYYNKEIEFTLCDDLVKHLGATIEDNVINDLTCFLNKIGVSSEPQEDHTIKLTIKDLATMFFKYKELRYKKESINNYLFHEILFQFIYSDENNMLNYQVANFWNEISDKCHSKITTMALQKMGNNLRLYKDTPFKSEKDLRIQADGFLSIAELVNTSIKLIRDCKAKKLSYCDEKIKENKISYEIVQREKQAFIVIDSIKNPFESNYLKDRYSNYYLITVYTDEEKRVKRLQSNLKLEQTDIQYIDIVEQLKKFKKTLNQYKKDKDILEKIKAENVTKAEKEESRSENKDEQSDDKNLADNNKNKTIAEQLPKMVDTFETMLSLNNNAILPFVMQNVQNCIELADIFINNVDDSSNHLFLKKILIRYVSLIMYPGLLLPTPVERNMQIANTAKSCSGCISRQVGAVITDNAYRLKSIGWNDVPENHVPCLYRDINELYNHCNEAAYSKYENDDMDTFQNSIKKPVEEFFSQDPRNISKTGRTLPYCFKDIYNDISNNKNQIHPRALHAEETAFLNLSRMGVDNVNGGYLFTTSSPCELCSKKAMFMGISKIYYIQPYPGISENHVLNSGPYYDRPEMVLFTGAIGRAYTQLYNPLISKKDELELWLDEKVSINVPSLKTTKKENKKNE